MVFLLIILYLIIRLVNLTSLPIFGDEAIYLDWGWRQIHIPGLLFYSVADAKQPLLLWIFGIIQSFPGDPLWQGRFVVVLFGLIALIGIYALTKKYFDQKTAIIAALLYLVIPLFSFFDRQALMETPVSAVSIWALYVFYDLIRTLDKKKMVLLGVLIVLDYYLKTSSVIYVLAMMIIVIYEWFKAKPSIKKKILVVVSGVFVITQLLLLPLYLKPAFWQSLSTNTRYVLSVKELIHLPFYSWISNLYGSWQIMFWQITPIIMLAAVIGSILIIKTRERFKMFNLFVFLVINLLFIIITRSAIPRYEVSLLPLICVIAAYALAVLITRNKIVGIMAILLTISFPVYVSYLQLTAPLTYFSFLQRFTPLSQMDLYVTNWTSGYGIPQAQNYLEQQAKNQTIHVGVRLDSGNPENAIFVYNKKSTNIIALYLDGRVMDKKILTFGCIKASTPLYFVSRDNNLALLDTYFQQEKRFYKPNSREYVAVYQLKSACKGKTLDLNFN